MRSRLEMLAPDGSASRVQPHQRISDKYELSHVLCSGGMGAIWVARNRVLGNDVAIKLLHETLMSEILRDRLIQEAQLAARVVHSNIVRVLDLGFTEWKAPYIVMELLDGRDLGAELEECGKLTPTRAVQLLLPVLEGLAFAHDHEIVHRDLKPENIFLDRAEGADFVVPKIVDFGIARCLSESGARRLTSSGSVFGTVDYLSPEQALGQDDVDHRADLWSFCAVLYQCVVGQAPFGDREEGLALKAIIEECVVPPSQLGVDDEGLEPILMRGLARDREERWPDARSLGQAMCRWLMERGVQEDASTQGVRSRWFGSIPDSDSPQPRLTTGESWATADATKTRTLARPTRAPGSAKWLVLGLSLVVVFLGSGLAFGSSSRSVSELNHASQPQIARLARSKPPKPGPMGAASVEPTSTTAPRAARVLPSAPMAAAAKPKYYDPILGF
jgi:serine/threonine-protein kinase